MFRTLLRFRWLLGLSLLFVTLHPCLGQQESRKLVTRVAPVYPDNLRKFNVNGIVKLEVVIAANGSVKDIHPLGGNPVLVDLAVDAVKKWKYSPASSETTAKVELTFMP